LYVMDAIVGMEGNGPRGGDPRAVNALLLSRDPVALDATACRMMHLDPELVPTVRWGHAWGLGCAEGVEVRGEALSDYVMPNYVVNRSLASTTGGHGLFMTLARKLVVPRPVIVAAECTRCGTCVRVCPVDPKAVQFHGRLDLPPTHNYTTCIRCYCCQEMCPEGAIHIETPLLGRVIKR
jgi:ferredoxin